MDPDDAATKGRTSVGSPNEEKHRSPTSGSVAVKDGNSYPSEQEGERGDAPSGSKGLAQEVKKIDDSLAELLDITPAATLRERSESPAEEGTGAEGSLGCK